MWVDEVYFLVFGKGFKMLLEGFKLMIWNFIYWFDDIVIYFFDIRWLIYGLWSMLKDNYELWEMK